MSIILTFLFLFFLFLFGIVGGMVLGIEIGAASATYIRDEESVGGICDGCDSEIKEQDATFCEKCFHEDTEDKLTAAIREKEMDIRYMNLALRQRNMVNKPDKPELEKLKSECEKVESLCEKVASVSEELNLIVNISPLQERNESLKTCIEKWEKIADREEKLDTMLNEVVSV